ncbi:cobalamin 5'-phosphate synthase [Bacillus solimangrovi]|uniref:Adenosylcobinamide-GDP ribazoletransferase n=2 Tax=Bacillus solimangrovi TaxID=1305675 RepID=A0A1E5LHT5_9BACI|nr:cobalamin 5'-phosphate synthase [Bacillus solimangrovi]
MRYVIDGFLLAFQFFTLIPINKNIEWEQRRARYAIIFLPFIGLIMGSTLAGISNVMHMFSLSNLAISVCILFFTVVVSGGLHLDGWMDCSDAYFSYRDKERRLDIMSDPHVGAFGVISLFFLLLFRWLFLYESVAMNFITTSLMLIVIPVLSRFGMVYLLTFTRTAKQSGLAFHFQKQLMQRDFFLAGILTIVPLLLIAWMFDSFIVLLVLFIIIIGFSIIFHFFVKHAFGGVTGDTLGACIEGGETVLWMIVWCLLSYATV